MMHHTHRPYKESFSFNFKIQRTEKMRKGKPQQYVTMGILINRSKKRLFLIP